LRKEKKLTIDVPVSQPPLIKMGFAQGELPG
jgi:hypothetical protein